MKQRVARRIKMARVERGWNQEQLAERLEISQRAVSKWEKGDINIGVDTLEHIASVLGKPFVWFFLPVEGMADSEAEPERRRAA